MAIPPIVNDASALAALIALGVPDTLAAAMLSHWKAEKQAKLVDLYGLHLRHDQAALLREKVTATREQFQKKLAPVEATIAALKSYGIAEPIIHALVSYWAAQTYKVALPP